MVVSLPGMIGAIVGVAIGILDFGIILSLLRRAGDVGGLGGFFRRFDARIGDWVRKGLFVINALLFAGLGYWFGSTLGG